MNISTTRTGHFNESILARRRGPFKSARMNVKVARLSSVRYSQSEYVGHGIHSELKKKRKLDQKVELEFVVLGRWAFPEWRICLSELRNLSKEVLWLNVTSRIALNMDAASFPFSDLHGALHTDPLTFERNISLPAFPARKFRVFVPCKLHQWQEIGPRWMLHATAKRLQSLTSERWLIFNCRLLHCPRVWIHFFE